MIQVTVPVQGELIIFPSYTTPKSGGPQSDKSVCLNRESTEWIGNRCFNFMKFLLRLLPLMWLNSNDFWFLCLPILLQIPTRGKKSDWLKGLYLDHSANVKQAVSLCDNMATRAFSRRGSIIVSLRTSLSGLSYSPPRTFTFTYSYIYMFLYIS